ncbi:mucin-17 isoform X1 [Rhagoletis pomonella]|uniref:mucin-17 isoform X1 n=1 Tax=Rhagoletis pomonella TaxID=28610 RepID=UPI00177B80D9|nr:mucin-17 isoform X1 [Rhagoletis pomonella]XP_036333034.1 mucin-17 isoform X1 [Rhagoletis pomonella]XP_036333035.1 mucin-17 isoform X1 [Rhagoletis pomonella]XP_036333036.1 mucin-17 isoform X1 [Rhagoletis pomonella]
MGIPQFCVRCILKRLPLLTWMLTLATQLAIGQSQDTSSYYFAAPNAQNRFVPSAAFQSNRQPAAHTAYLSGSRGGAPLPNGAYSQPDSYQEQLLFISNDGKQQQQQQQQQSQQQSSAAAYSPFGAQISQTRNPDFYDISPRPFGAPASTGLSTAASGFTRSKAIRPNSGGFVPSQQTPIRVNVPHQQTQFLAHFNEPASSSANRPSANSLTGSFQRPFGSGGFVPTSNRNRPVAAAAAAASTNYNSDFSPNSSQSSFSQTPFKNSRNRFQPNSANTPTTTASTEAPASSTKRYNRFGASRTQNSLKSQPQQQQQTAYNNPEASSQRPSFGRVTGNKSSSFQPRRPVFISREVNEPVSVAKVQRPFAAGRVKLPVKESLFKQSTAAAVKTTSAVTPSSESEEYDEEEDSNSANFTATKETSLEKLELHEAEETTVATTVDTTHSTAAVGEEDTTALPADDEKSSVTVEQATADEMDDESNSEAADVTTNRSSEYEDEYGDEEESTDPTVTIPKHNQTSTSAAAESATISSTSEAKVTTTTELPLTSVSDEELEDANADILTTAPHEATTPMPPNHKVTEEDEAQENEDANYEASADYEDEEYEEEDGELEETEDANQEPERDAGASSSPQDDKDTIDREVVSVVTTKSVVNGSTAFPSPVTQRSTTTLASDEEAIFVENNMQPAKVDEEKAAEVLAIEKTADNSTANDESMSNTTESYVVIASIQTSRSINGARFLPFPAIEQEETKQTLSELERKIHSQKTTSKKNGKDVDTDEPMDSGEEVMSHTVEKSSTNAAASSTESIIDKLDRVQSELSSGLLSGKYPIITEMDVSTKATTTTSGSRFVPNIRKFQPKTTAASKVKVHHFDESEMDELAGLLPVGFKPRSSYKNRKIATTTTSTTIAPEVTEAEVKKPARNSTIGRSFKNNAVVAQDVAVAGLLPKGYKPPATTEATTKADIKDLFSKIKFDDNLDKLLPKDYKEKAATTPKPAVTLVDDISKFLPPGYKLSSTATPMRKPVAAVSHDISKLLPPGYKPPAKSDDESDKLAGAIIPIKADDISKFLPPGFKLNDTIKKDTLPAPETIDISQLLPKGFKPTVATEKTVQKTEVKTVEEAMTTLTVSSTTESSTGDDPLASTTAASGFKVVFPKGVHKRLGATRLTTPRTVGEVQNNESGNSPAVVIKKGPPTRATTEFTGWPTPSTTPISIEKLLELSRTVSINFEDLLSSSSTSTTTSTTTTTTTTTPRPTKPGHCTADCDLAATIKIIDGVAWKPELLDHNTLEWKNLAHEVEAELNEVYAKAPQLSRWYKKVRIDSFSQGSVLVDYYVELANITDDVNTLEIKKLFHDALTHPPPEMILAHKPETENETDNEDEEESASGKYREAKEEKLIKETFLMGKYVIDPAATDFSVIPKSLSPMVEFAEEDLLIPQWAIVVIVIGVGSLIFVVIFGVTVLLNRQKRSKKTPIALTSDMLNELKVNHMGGAENYGVDDFYNIDDAWNDTKQPIKPKRFTNSLHGSNSSNIYDSWRSTRHGDYFHDSQTNYSQKGDSLQRAHQHHHHQQQQQPHSQHHHHHQQQQQHHTMSQLQHPYHQYPDAFADAHPMYTYNNNSSNNSNHASRASRYQRDYDPDF